LARRRPAACSRAHLLAQLGRHREAVADAQALVDMHPQRSADDWFNLGYLLAETREPEADGRAEAAFRRCLEMNPGFDRAWYGLGLALQRQCRREEAIAAWRRAAELQPMGPHAWVQLARAHLLRGEVQEVQRIVEHLAAFEPAVAARLAAELGLPR
jgi:tetratricopeptide (TPR) repeat protein